MVNRLKGEASFTVDGQTFTLVFDAEALLAIEDALDIGLIELFGNLKAAQDDPRKVRIGTLATMVACGLQRHHPGVDRGFAADLLLHSMAEIEGALAQSLGGSMPQPRDDQGAGSADQNPPAAAKAAKPGGTGKLSSASGVKPGSRQTPSGKARRG